MKREFDIVIYGITSFTGKYVAKHYRDAYHGQSQLKVAVAARNKSKAEKVLQELGLDLPVLVADCNDTKSLSDMCARTKAVVSLVGPYLLYGIPLVEAAVQKGTHVVDLTGETSFMKETSERFHAKAAETGSLIVSACGFDSVPSDINVLLAQEAFLDQHKENVDHLVCYVSDLHGGFSGGSAATFANMLKNKSWSELAEMKARMHSPYYLADKTPLCMRDTKNTLSGPVYDEHAKAYINTWLMAGINSQVVRRSLVARQDQYKDVPSYLESTTIYGTGLKGLIGGRIAQAGMSLFMLSMIFGPSGRLVENYVLPKPGEGPSEHLIETGRATLTTVGFSKDKAKKTTVVAKLNRDPGYGATAVMIFESAVVVCENPLKLHGGFHTPSNALGHALVERLNKTGIVTFTVENA